MVNKLKLKINRVPFGEALACIHSESQPLPGLRRAPTRPSALGSSLWVQIHVVSPASFIKKRQICPHLDLGRKQNKFWQGFNSDQTHFNWNVCFAPTRGTKNNKETREAGLQWMQVSCSLGFMQSPPAKNLITVQFPHGDPTQEYLR